MSPKLWISLPHYLFPHVHATSVSTHPCRYYKWIPPLSAFIQKSHHRGGCGNFKVISNFTQLRSDRRSTVLETCEEAPPMKVLLSLLGTYAPLDLSRLILLYICPVPCPRRCRGERDFNFKFVRRRCLSQQDFDVLSKPRRESLGGRAPNFRVRNSLRRMQHATGPLSPERRNAE